MFANSSEVMVLKLEVWLEQTPRNPSKIRVDLFQNFPFKFEKNSILKILHTYVVVLTLDAHNPCNRRYILHITLCLSAT